MSRRTPTNNSPKALADVMKVIDLVDLLRRLGVTDRRLINKHSWVEDTLANTHSSAEIRDGCGIDGIHRRIR